MTSEFITDLSRKVLTFSTETVTRPSLCTLHLLIHGLIFSSTDKYNCKHKSYLCFLSIMFRGLS